MVGRIVELFKVLELLAPLLKYFRRYKYNLFISYPMKPLGLEESKKLYEVVLVSKNAIQNYRPDFKIFASVDNLIDEKEGEKTIPQTDSFEALRKSKKYLLIYPKVMASSVLIELGYALCMDKQIIILAKKFEDLPYLLQTRINRFKCKNITIQYFNDESLQRELQNAIKNCM